MISEQGGIRSGCRVSERLQPAALEEPERVHEGGILISWGFLCVGNQGGVCRAAAGAELMLSTALDKSTRRMGDPLERVHNGHSGSSIQDQ